MRTHLIGLAALIAAAAVTGCAEDAAVDSSEIIDEPAAPPASQPGAGAARPGPDPEGTPGPTGKCKGPNPAKQCRTSADQCIPSQCSCAEGGWRCTEDCGGGTKCDAVAEPPPPLTCKGPNPAQQCRTSADQCLPSRCSCSDGGWICTRDCGGGATCAEPVPTPGPTTCKTPNPAQTCRTSADQCIPSQCGCNDGRWTCTADCGGGATCAKPVLAPTSCTTPNPAGTCRTSADQCIPSQCGCNDGRWTCTADCGGGITCGGPPPPGRR